MTREVDIAFVPSDEVALAGASFAPSLLDAPAVAKLLCDVAVRTRHLTGAHLQEHLAKPS